MIMYKAFKHACLSLLLTVICAYGMNEHNEIVYTSDVPEQRLPNDIMRYIATHCQPHEKNRLMKVCKVLNTYLKNKDEILRINPLTVHAIDKQNCLFKNINSGNTEMVKFLLDVAKVNPHCTDILGRTLLHLALQVEDANCVKVLHDRGVFMKEELKHIHSLHEAAYNNDISKAGQAFRVDLNAVINHCAPLHIAAHEGHVEMVQFLLKSGADINLKNNNDETALWIASQKGHADVVALLMNARAKYCANKEGITPLYIAAKNGHLGVVQVLIKNDNVYIDHVYIDETCGKHKATPLHVAVDNDHIEVIRALIKGKADVNKRTHEYVELNETVRKSGMLRQSPLFIAADHGFVYGAKLLLRAKAEINCGTSNGLTALHVAAAHGHVAMVTLLLGAKAGINIRDYDGVTPLHAACVYGHAHIVKIFISHGVDVNCQTKNGLTPLCEMARKGYLDIAKLLLCAEADVNKAIDRGWTPLHLAVKHGHYDMVKLLLAAGADVRLSVAIKHEELTAFQLAQREKQYVIAQLLRDHAIGLKQLQDNKQKESCVIQ